MRKDKNNNLARITDPYVLFRHLITSLDIRKFGHGRDALLYESLRKKLDMGSVMPKAFFREHPEIKEQDVLEVFMQVLEPFVLMVEEIYSTLGRFQQQALGGKDFSIRYDFDKSSLDFNLDAFRIFEKQLLTAKLRGWTVKHNSDAVPGLRYEIERIKGMRLSQWATKSKSLQLEKSDFKKLLQDIRELASVHIFFLDRVIRDWEIQKFEINENVLSLHYAIENATYVKDIQRVRDWREYAYFAVRTIPQIDVNSVFEKCTHEEILSQYEALRWIRDSLGERRIREGYLEIILEFLQLPYWKKRWQVFEIWIFSLFLLSLAEKGLKLNPDKESRLVLKTGESEAPKARLQLGQNSELEIWTEFPIKGKGLHGLRPDIAIIINEIGIRKPVGIIECKQRETEVDKVLISDAEKYAKSIREGARNLLVNYDKFKGPAIFSGFILQHNGVETLFLDCVQPKTAQRERIVKFVSNLIQGTILGVTFVVDTTGSMHGTLGTVWKTIQSLCATISENSEALFSAVLFGEHGPDEPYLTKEFAFTNDAKCLLRELESTATTGGGDTPEALEDAIRVVNSLQCPKSAQGIVFLFLDAPPHSVSECPKGIDFEIEVTNLLDKSKIWVVNCGNTSWQELGWSKFEKHQNLTLVLLNEISPDTVITRIKI